MRKRPPGRASARAGALALAVAVVVSFAVIGCGGGGGGGGTSSGSGSSATPGSAKSGAPGAAPSTSDDQLIRAAIVGVLASRDPAQACDRYTTTGFIQGAFGDANGCKAAVGAPGEAARSVQVSGVSVAGDKASALAVPSGGPSNRERLQVQLVKQGGVWKVDALLSNAPVGP